MTICKQKSIYLIDKKNETKFRVALEKRFAIRRFVSSIYELCLIVGRPSKHQPFVLTSDDKSQRFAKLKELFATTQADPKTAHLILPNRTTTLRTLWTKTRKGKVHFADFIILGQLK